MAQFHKPWVPQRPQVPPPDLAAPAPPPPPPSQDGPPLALPGPAWLRFHKPWLRAGRPLMPQPSNAGAVPPVPPPPPAFPDVPLDLTCQLDLPADGWTDVTGDVYQRDSNTPVTVTRGRPDESSQVNPSSAAFQLNNRSGNFTVKNPAGAYYGQLNRNTPVRFSVPAAGNYLRLEEDTVSCASCPDTSQLDITGDTDVRIDLQLSSYVPCTLATKWTSSTNKTWALYLNGDGTVTIEFWDGTTDHAITSTVPVPLGRVAIRATIQVNNGSGGHVATFYTAPDISGTWTQLGVATTGTGAITLAVSTAPVVVGYSAGYIVTDSHSAYTGPAGMVFAFQLLNGIGGGLAASAGFAAQPAGTTSFADGRGNTWTLSGTAEISDRDYRYHGEMASLPVAWDPSGNDWWVPVTAGGLLRRLGQGNAPVYSAMKRAVLALSGALAPVVYWPCEDLGGASAFGSAIGGPLMNISGTPAFAGDTAFACSAALPTINTSTWYGAVPSYSGSGSIVVRFLLDLSSTPGLNVPIVTVITTGGITQVNLYAGAGDGGFGLSGSGVPGFGFDTGAYDFGLTQAWVSIEIQPLGGGDVQYSLVMLAPGASTGEAITAATSGGVTVGNAVSVIVNPSGAAISGCRRPLHRPVAVAVPVRPVRAAGRVGRGAGREPVRPALLGERVRFPDLRVPGRHGGDGAAVGVDADGPAAGMRVRRPRPDLRAPAGARAGLPHPGGAVQPGPGRHAGLLAGRARRGGHGHDADLRRPVHQERLRRAAGQPAAAAAARRPAGRTGHTWTTGRR